MLNYNYKIPVMCVKKLFDENIQTYLKDDFLNVLENFDEVEEEIRNVNNQYADNKLILLENSEEEQITRLPTYSQKQ